LACAAPPHQGLEAYYEVSLIESAQTQQRVHVRARFTDLEPGPTDFSMVNRWAGYSDLAKQVSWIKIGGSEAACVDVARSSDSSPDYDAAYWRVQVPKSGKLELEYYIELSGQDGAVPSEVWSDHALLLSRSLFVTPAVWLDRPREPLGETVGVKVASPAGWPVYTAWPLGSGGGIYLPDSLEDLLDGAIALGHYHGYEMQEGPFHLRLLLPPQLEEGYARRRATGLGFNILSVCRFFKRMPDSSEDTDLLFVAVASDGHGEPLTGDMLADDLILARTSADLPSTLDAIVLQQAIRLWNGGAVRAAERKIPLEMGKISQIQYWNHLRHVTRMVARDPVLDTISLAQAEEQIENDPALRQFLCHKGHLLALLLDESLRTRSNGESDLVDLFLRLDESHNYYATGRLVGEDEVIQAIAEETHRDDAVLFIGLLQGVGALDLTSIPQLSGPPTGETHILPTTDGLQLVYQWVDGPTERTAIYLSGGPGLTPYDWMYSAAEPLRHHVDVAYLEQRGCGRSARPGSGAYSLNAYINDIELLREQEGAEKVVLIGHAWGSYCALEYATRYPERVDALVLISPIPSFPRAVGSALEGLAEQVQEDSIDVDLPLDEYLRDGVHTYHDLALLIGALEQAKTFGDDPAMVKAATQAAYAHYVDISLLPNGVPLENEEILPTLVARDRLLEYDLMQDLQSGDYPVLILHGARDRTLSRSLLESLRGIMHGKIAEIASAGRYVYLDNPSATVGKILSFLEANPR
jgi:proline iminopeptidase